MTTVAELPLGGEPVDFARTIVSQRNFSVRKPTARATDSSPCETEDAVESWRRPKTPP